MADIDTQGRLRPAGLTGAVPPTLTVAPCDLERRVLAGFWRRSLQAGAIYERYCAAVAGTEPDHLGWEQGREPG